MAKDLLNGLTFVLVLLGTTASPLSAATLDKITASYGANFRLIIAAVGINGSAGQPNIRRVAPTNPMPFCVLCVVQVPWRSLRTSIAVNSPKPNLLLRITIVGSLRGLRKFSGSRRLSDSDIPPAKTPRR
jgi:hypothetical protein